MKQIRLLTLSMLLIQSIMTTAQTQDKAGTQDEETKAAIKEFKIVDDELNNVFNKILAAYKSDVEFIKNIKVSQALWVKFRTAELNAKFPKRSPGAYGDVYTICVNDYLTELTNERITKLNTWLKGTYEGDVCSGSIKIE